jgi:hypothetical protein
MNVEYHICFVRTEYNDPLFCGEQCSVVLVYFVVWYGCVTVCAV